MIQLSIKIDGGRLEIDKRFTKATLRAAGGEVAALTRAMIRRSQGSGRLYRGPGGSARQYRGGYKPGRYTASSPGQPPVSVTRSLANSVVVRPFKSGEGVAVRERQFYALFLAVGARGGGKPSRVWRARNVNRKTGLPKRAVGVFTSRVLEPRPSLTAALEQREASIAQRVRQSIMQGLKFQRQKVGR